MPAEVNPMPMHDWTRVPDGIYHSFHHDWISEIGRSLNRGLLPPQYYALYEQSILREGTGKRFGPDVLTLKLDNPDDRSADSGGVATLTGAALQTRPSASILAETDAEYYRQRKKSVAVRHATDDRLVAVIEIVSPGNKSNRKGVEAFVGKACELLDQGVHLLVADPFPPGPRDPGGMHGLIWEDLTGTDARLPEGKPLSLASYEADQPIRAYVEPLAVGDRLPDMPLFLVPDGCVMVPMESTYATAFEVQPRRWRDVLQPPAA